MAFTDLFIKRPVLASVVSLLILVVGLRALFSLEVRQYPQTQDTVVTVTTTYPGASAELMAKYSWPARSRSTANSIESASPASRNGSSDTPK